jgi:hypothetical protein
MEGNLPKPANVGTYLATAFTAWDCLRRVIRVPIFERCSVACVAAALEKLAVHMNHVSRTSLFMEIVDVLRAEE